MEKDRVSFSFGMKLSLPTKYESADFHVSLTSDVQEGETSVTAFQRVKREVEMYAELAYQQIRNSETGLTNEQQAQPGQQSPNQRDVSAPTNLEGTTASEPTRAATDAPKPRDLKVLRQQIKQAYGVLEAQKKTTASSFKSQFLGGKKTDELNELEVTKAIVLLREVHPQLGL